MQSQATIKGLKINSNNQIDIEPNQLDVVLEKDAAFAEIVALGLLTIEKTLIIPDTENKAIEQALKNTFKNLIDKVYENKKNNHLFIFPIFISTKYQFVVSIYKNTDSSSNLTIIITNTFSVKAFHRALGFDLEKCVNGYLPHYNSYLTNYYHSTDIPFLFTNDDDNKNKYSGSSALLNPLYDLADQVRKERVLKNENSIINQLATRSNFMHIEPTLARANKTIDCYNRQLASTMAEEHKVITNRQEQSPAVQTPSAEDPQSVSMCDNLTSCFSLGRRP